ncbi:MAG: ATP-binding protein [Gemmatimonadetes bacterium]|nr:ATP-binding protein [Gemmatimonadota bacterium]
MNDVVNGSLEMLRRVIGENVHLEFAPAADLWPVLADAIQLDHILTNLCLNARDAIGDSGSVVVTTSNEIIGEAGHVAKPEAVPGDYVRLTVRDDGSGISQEVLPHIFEPFFTTKGVGKGTGIGLAAVYGAVHQMHGFITVHSERGRGAAFDIYLPRYGKDLVEFPQPVAEADAETPRHGSRGQETILLVEDDAGLLLFAQRVLEEEGYCVIAARSPADAVRFAAAEPRLDLLLTDVVMPGMNGLDLMRTLQATRPSLKCVFMSAYRADDMIERYGLPPEGPFVAKPFRLQEIRATVRAELDRS